MAVTGLQNVRTLVQDAARKAGVLDIGEEWPAEQMEAGVRELFRMLKSWQAQPGTWTRQLLTVTLTNATGSYALSPRPVRVLDAWFRRSGLDTPMQAMTQAEYDMLPNKASAGIPTTFYYERLVTTGTLYVWPVLSVAAGETVVLRVEREIEDPTGPNDAIDAPSEWYDCIVYGLAARFVEDYAVRGPQAQLVVARAAEMLRQARAFSMDDPVLFSER